MQASRIGGRDTNEDRVAHWSAPGALLMAVADGLGGHLHGELAAQIAVDILGAAFTAEAQPKLADPAAFLSRAVSAGHVAIVHEAMKLDLVERPRTVLVACLVQDGAVFWSHVGDSRFYLVRQGRVLARTNDHTVVQQLVDEGRIAQDAAATHPYRNRLLRCLGGYQPPRIDPPGSAQLANGDIVLLCSDGLWGPLPQAELVQGLLERPLAEAIPHLVDDAERRGGPECDNISVMAITWNQSE